KTDAVAVIACHRALERWIATADPSGRDRYRATQDWYRRHALREASEGGLFPDLFIRRFDDDLELSWSATPPLFAPDGFQFIVEPGHARLPVAEVGDPLWRALQWVASQPPSSLDERDQRAWSSLCDKIISITRLTDFDLDAAFVAPNLLVEVREALARIGRSDLATEALQHSRPFVETFSPAVAMFGGVNPNLTPSDVGALCEVLARTAGGYDGEQLRRLVYDADGGSPGVPYAEGYGL